MSQQVATAPQSGQVVQADANSIMEMISRAASDPNVDVDKLERLMAMAERLGSREAETAYDQAMNAAQEEMRPIATDAHNPQTKSKYASYAALDRAIRPIYTKHGFSLSFGTAEGAPDDQVRVVCRVARAGHKETVQLDMPCDGKGAKGGDVMTKTHAMGAALTYGKRYLLGMIFNIAVGEDKDGNAPAGPSITQDQADALRELAEDVGADVARFCAYFRVQSLSDIPASRHKAAETALEGKRVRS